MSLVESLSANSGEDLLEHLESRLSNYHHEISDEDLAIMGVRRKIETDYDAYVEEYARTMFDKIFDVINEATGSYTGYFMFKDDKFHRDTHEALCYKLGIDTRIYTELEVFDFVEQGLTVSRQAMMSEAGDLSTAYALSYVAKRRHPIA